MSPQTNDIYEFEGFRFDTVEKALRCGDAVVPITPKVFETLLIFLKHPGHLIEKTELMETLWPNRFVEESNLTFNIKMLRKALGDDAQSPRFLETVPTRGYRFIADVRRTQKELRNGSELSGSSASAARSESRIGPGEPDGGLTMPVPASADPILMFGRKYLVLAAAGLIVTAVGLGYYFWRASQPVPVPSGVMTILVLPVRPIDSATRDEDYEIGIADSIINRINSIKGLLARPLNSARKYIDIEHNVVAAGREQQVDFVLASTYQLADGKIRINSHLIDVASGETKGAYTTERDARNIFAMQDAVAGEIGSRLMTQFSTVATGPVAKRGTDNDDAYRLYLDGMYLYDRRTLADAENAVSKLEQATQIDPNYAKAWAGKAHVHRSLGNFSGSRSPHEEYQKSIAAVTRALELDKDLADAHSALCENKFFYEYDFEGAERACKRAIELDPNSFLAHEIYSRCLWTLSRFDEAIAEVKTAIDLEPTSLFSQRNLAISLFYAGRFGEANHQFNRVSEMDPSFVANYAWFVPALLVEGRESEAFEWFIKWQILLKSDDATLQGYRKAYLASGWFGIGRERLKRFDENKVRSYFLEACLMAHTGNTDKTIEYLEKSYERREWGIPFLRIDPSLDSIRSDPRFVELARRVERSAKIPIAD